MKDKHLSGKNGHDPHGERTPPEQPYPVDPGQVPVEDTHQLPPGQAPGQPSHPPPPPGNYHPRAHPPPHPMDRPPEDTIISLFSVSKTYKKTLGLNGVTLFFGKGITGLLGDNGSGKSTMLKLMTGLLKPSSGTVNVFGVNPRNNPRIFRKIGYCPEDDAFYSGMNGRDYVAYFLRLNGFEKPEADRRAGLILEKLDLDKAAMRPVDGYSKGMKQRVKLARAIVTDPEILILDEPLQGTDPEARHLIIENLLEWGKRGKTIVISSHILREIDRLTDNIVLLSKGRVVARGDTHDLRRMMDSLPHSILIIPRNPNDARRLAAILVEKEYVASAGVESGTGPGTRGKGENRVQVNTREPSVFYSKIARLLHKHRIPIKHLSSQDDNLETLYNYLMWGPSRKVI